MDVAAGKQGSDTFTLRYRATVRDLWVVTAGLVAGAIALLFWAGLLVLTGLGLVGTGQDPTSPVAQTLVLILGLILIGYVFFRGRGFLGSFLDSILTERTVRIDDEGIHRADGHGVSVTYGWAAIAKVTVTGRWVTVVGTRRAPLIKIPRRAFGSESDAVSFRDAVQVHVSGARG